jgi:small subunit ribosomal protein S6
MVYELVYSIPANVTDAEVAPLQASVTSLLEREGAKISRNESAGKLKHAYPVGKTRYGHYFLVQFTAEKPALPKIREALRLSAGLSRAQIVAGARPITGAIRILSHEEARQRAREDRMNAASVRSDERTAPVAAPPAASSAPRPTISQEEVDKKIEQMLAETAA